MGTTRAWLLLYALLCLLAFWLASCAAAPAVQPLPHGLYDSPAFMACRLACAAGGMEVHDLYETMEAYWCDCTEEKKPPEGT